MNKPEEIKPDEKVCFNCKYIFWGIALGLGLRCTHSNNKKIDEKKFLPLIPNRRHTCEFFEFANTRGENGS